MYFELANILLFAVLAFFTVFLVVATVATHRKAKGN